MATIRYETESGVFEFDHDEVKTKLAHYANNENIEEAKELIGIISPPANDTITIPKEFQFIVNVIFDLLVDDKGAINCKPCDKPYIPRDLKSFGMFPGKTPFEIKRSKSQKQRPTVFRKNRRISGMFGGKGYKCPENHDLISMITWTR